MLPEGSENHVMIVERTHSTGADEWYCPTCGRRLVIQLSPVYKKIVLDVGDENAAHSGGKGGLSISLSQVIPPEQLSTTNEPQADDPTLASWKKWMDGIDFESWWGQDLQ